MGAGASKWNASYARLKGKWDSRIPNFYNESNWGNIQVLETPIGDFDFLPQAAQTEKTRDNRIEKNIFYRNKGAEIYFIYPISESTVQMSDYNLFYHTEGKYEVRIDWVNHPFDYWMNLYGKGYDAHSLFADPLFIDPDNMNYKLKSDSPVFGLGFKDIDVSAVGLTANQYPDHTTISRFRKDNQSHLRKLFLEILQLCAEAGLVKLGNVSLDGTKIKANASLSANRTLKHLEQEIDTMLSEAEAKDAEEDEAYGADKRGDELPEELRERNSRISRLKACKGRLEQEKARAEKQQQDKIDERTDKENETGKKPRSRQREPQNRNSGFRRG